MNTHFVRNTFVILACFLAATQPAAAVEPAEWLNWTGKSRKVIRARFVELIENKNEKSVILATQDGKQFTVDFNNLDLTSQRQALQQADGQANQSITDLRKMVFVKIPGGGFTMGSPVDEKDRATNGEPTLPIVPNANGQINPADLKPRKDYELLRDVRISKDYWMKQTEVTWKEWNAVRSHAEQQGYIDLGEGRNGHMGDKSGNHPVTGITWWDAVKWCNLKSQIENRKPAYHLSEDFNGAAIFKTGTSVPSVDWTADGYRLPTEAEWERACREGKDTKSNPYHGDLEKIAWYAANSGGNTHPVGTAVKNKHNFDLYDMHGNVAEWCWDWVDLLEPGKFEDPKGADSGSFRIFRGGSWADPARSCRAAYRGTFSPAAPSSSLVGFRPVCGADPAKSPEP